MAHIKERVPREKIDGVTTKELWEMYCKNGLDIRKTSQKTVKGKEQEEVGQGSKSHVLSWALKTFDPITSFLPSVEEVSHLAGQQVGR